MRKDIIISALLIFAGIVLMNMCLDKRAEKHTRDLKQKIIESDTIRFEGGSYKKYVYEDKSKLKRLQVVKSNITLLPIVKIDTVTKIIKCEHITSYYPDEENYFVKYSYHNKISRWDFKPLNFDLEINETKLGIYEASLTGKEWLKVGTLNVNMLPRPKVKTRHFIIGAGMNGKNISLWGGGQYKRIVGLGGISPNGNYNFLLGYKI